MGTRDTPSSAGRTSVQAIVDALSSPVRREILWLVWDTERSAGEIAASFDLTAGTISSHLSALRDAVDPRLRGLEGAARSLRN